MKTHISDTVVSAVMSQIGRMGRGQPKTMSRAALRQRREASRQPRPNARGKRKARPLCRTALAQTESKTALAQTDSLTDK